MQHAIMNTTLVLISFFGFLSLFKNTVSLTKWIFITFFRKPKDLTKYGAWALVTGSTDGIGKALAFQLAQRGLNLILVSRNQEKLTSVSNEILLQFPGTEVKVIELDFGNPQLNVCTIIQEAVRELDVGVLINNVGVTYPAASYFHETDEEIWMKVLRVNLEGTTFLTRAVLPGMIERKRGGAIVNIGSGAGIIVPSHPLYIMYSATKVYIDKFSRCLHQELKDYGIHVECQVPLYVATEMYRSVASLNKNTVPMSRTLWTPTAQEYADAAIRRVGYEARCTPHWIHSIQCCILRMVPESILDAWRLYVNTRRRNRGQMSLRHHFNRAEGDESSWRPE